jgi:hypothetical protein
MDCRVKPGNDGIGKRPGAIPAFFRHCERSEAIQSSEHRLDCFVASALRNDGALLRSLQ